MVLGTTWFGYELVIGTSWSGYELVLGTSWLRYELAWYDLVRVRVDWKPYLETRLDICCMHKVDTFYYAHIF